MSRRQQTVCSCSGRPPWPAMTRLSVGGLNRYYFCSGCERVREEVCCTDGTIIEIRYHALDSSGLSPASREQALAMKRLGSYVQGRLFEE